MATGALEEKRKMVDERNGGEAMSRKVHKIEQAKLVGGGYLTGLACGRDSGLSHWDWKHVTCKFCLKRKGRRG